MLELRDRILVHGGAPSLPREYCDAVNGLRNGPEVGSCGTSTYTGRRVLVEDIATDRKWANIKHVALPHGLRCCWSEPIKNSSGKVLGAFGMYYNHPALPNQEELNDLIAAARLAGIVMERDQTQKRIRELAYTDVLTGLASRACFYQELEESINIHSKNNRPFSLLYIDLDDFKYVNDSLGHDSGDLLLNEIAKSLKETCRDVDFISRLGGDEFCILVKDISDAYNASHLACRCLEAISKPIQLGTRKITPACSIGIASYPDDGRDLSTLLKAADISLYAAKDRGKNQFVHYGTEFTDRAEYDFRLEQDLQDAVEKEQLSLVYQPQLDINTGEVIGVEVLARWRHPQLGQIPPNKFIAIAEKTGTIKPLTEWVLRTVGNQIISWRQAGLAPFRVAINISPIYFLDKDFTTLVQSVIDETGISPEDLELEITESVAQTDEENLVVFQKLKALGVSLAIDDFGTGYSSFASLKHLMVNSLKIDKYFIDDMLVDRKSQLLVGSMIEMSHGLGYRIVAEGVETAEQCDLLRQLGCDSAQGYLFSKPISANQLVTFLANHSDWSREPIRVKVGSIATELST